MFLVTTWFKILDVRNHLALSLSYDGCSKVNRCAMQKLVFPYKWLEDYGKLTHIEPVAYEAFYSSLKGGPTITQDEYNEFI